jgi:hypothetical protein
VRVNFGVLRQNTMSDARLAKLLTIFRGGSGDFDPRWQSVEKGVGLSLPGSYKTLVDFFGASSWCDFLHVLSPFVQGQLNLLDLGKQVLDADRETRDQFPSHYPFGLFPEQGGLFPWAFTDNGDTLYFITSGLADDWPTVIKGPRAPEFEVSFLDPALLVHHFAAGTFQSTILPTMEG